MYFWECLGLGGDTGQVEKVVVGKWYLKLREGGGPRQGS